MAVSVKFFISFVIVIFPMMLTAQDLTGYSKSTKDNSASRFRIVGGNRHGSRDVAKYTISLRKYYPEMGFGTNHRCGGTIIGPWTILTAAHCVYNLSTETGTPLIPMHAVASTPRRLKRSKQTQVIEVENVVIHSGYDPMSQVNDIALLHLSRPVKEDGISASRISYARSVTPTGTNCTAAGWGRIFGGGPMPDEILCVHLIIKESKSCVGWNMENIGDGMICATNAEDLLKDTCQGDSGGPLICNNRLVGVISFGIGCGWGIPGVYTDVYFYKDWIEENLKNSKIGVSFPSVILVFILTYVIRILRSAMDMP